MMDDYITVLLQYLNEHRADSVEYLRASRHLDEASEALCETLSPEQHKLFLAYEEAANAVSCISEDDLTRSAFLLAREIFR